MNNERKSDRRDILIVIAFVLVLMIAFAVFGVMAYSHRDRTVTGTEERGYGTSEGDRLAEAGSGSLRLNFNWLTFPVNEKRTLKAFDADSKKELITVTWESADPSVVRVDNYGVLTPVGLGNTTVTATSAVDGSCASCKVTIIQSYEAPKTDPPTPTKRPETTEGGTASKPVDSESTITEPTITEPTVTEPAITEPQTPITMPSYSFWNSMEHYEEGQHKVGVDIPAGEYVLIATTKYNGYFFVTADPNGEDTLFSDGFRTNAIVTVFDGEYLQLTGCVAIPSAQFYGEYRIDTGRDGVTLLVGKDIPAGEYKLIPSDPDWNGYYFLYADSRQDDCIDSDGFKNQSYVRVRDGQYLKLSNCLIAP